MDRYARRLCASMLLGLGAAPLAGCGESPSKAPAAAAPQATAPALLDSGALADVEARAIDASQVTTAAGIDYRVARREVYRVDEPIDEVSVADDHALPAIEAPQALSDLSTLSAGEEPAQRLTPEQDDSILPLDEDDSPQSREAPEAEVIEAAEQTRLPWAKAADIDARQLAPVAARADELARRGFELADRGAFFSARSEFIAALRLMSDAIDLQQQTLVHSRALSAGVRAIQEADDFVLDASAARGRLNLKLIVAGHATPLFRGQPLDGLSPVVARQRYLSYAQEQLTAAAGGQPSCSLAMYGLGKVAMQAALREPRQNLAASGRAMVWHQAALMTDGRNFRAANELGVLVARSGNLAAARMLFERSLSLSPQPAAWDNLAAVHDRLGEKDLAVRARGQASLAASGVAGSGVGATVRWVDPSTFARSAGATDGLQAPTPGALPPSATAAKQPAKKSASLKNLWNGPSRR